LNQLSLANKSNTLIKNQVLINPHKRAIYDTLGIKGLEQDDLQLVIRSKTPKEIREEYERLSKEREERRLEKITYSQGQFSMQVDASRIFDTFVDEESAKRIQKFDKPLNLHHR
jgi:DnaJ family protein C protein 11